MQIKDRNNKSLRLRAYSLIKDKILILALKPGEKIFEKRIAEYLDTSRTPVREALLLLESEGLVECESGNGYRVRALSGNEVSEFIGIRRALELFAAPLITERITEFELRELSENIRASEEYLSKGDMRNLLRCETEFHLILYKSAHSQIFFRTISSLVDKFQLIRGTVLLSPDAVSISVSHHKMFLAALEKRNSQEFCNLIELHLNAALEQYKQSPLAMLFEKPQEEAFAKPF